MTCPRRLRGRFKRRKADCEDGSFPIPEVGGFPTEAFTIHRSSAGFSNKNRSKKRPRWLRRVGHRVRELLRGAAATSFVKKDDVMEYLYATEDDDEVPLLGM